MQINRRILYSLFLIPFLLSIFIHSTLAVDHTEPVPLPELGNDTYLGKQGGLYPNGQNTPPTQYVTNEIEPAFDTLENDSHIVVLCLGMSNLTHTCDALINKMDIDTAVNPSIKMINAGQPGRAQQAWDGDISATDGVWVNANKRLTQEGETPASVDVVIYFNAWAIPTENDFSVYQQTMHNSLTITMANIASLYQNTQLIYVTSREYAGHATVDLNPDPWAYWDGFAFKQLVEDRINGTQSGPPLLWTAYQYDQSWPASYYNADGTHLSEAGLNVASQSWLDFFKTESWFVANGAPPPILDKHVYIPFVTRTD